MKRLLAACTIVFALFSATTASAYDYISQCGPSWSNLPVPYYINSAGSADLPFATVQSIIKSSFDSWGDPCCSEFAAAYQGTTSQTAMNNSYPVVLSWTENSWDPGLGNVNSTIGVTFTQRGGNCTMYAAPIIFNGVGFSFTNNGGGTDLQSIATHEIGHLLGLDHSSISSATMYASYSGGTGARSLHQDDINGVCSLYFSSNCSCTTTSMCGTGQQCLGGLCRLPPCTSDASCDSGLSCLPNGDCGIPPCASDADCAADFSCQGNVCLSSCAVCRRCEVNNDCGTGNFCYDFGDGKRCWVQWSNSTPCPGDSVEYTTEDGNGNTIAVCGSPTAQQTGLCQSGTAINPVDYVCKDDGINDECRNFQDCANGELCVPTEAGRRCQVPPDPCVDVTCGAGLMCMNGFCIRDETSTNNVPGNNTTGPTNNQTTSPINNTPGNNTPGNNGNPTNGIDTTIIVFGDEPVDESNGCCATTAPRRTPEALMLLIGAFIWTRRRR